MDEKLRVSLHKVEAYEKIINVIDSSKTESHSKSCYAMIDLFDGLFQDSSLTEQLTDIANSKFDACECTAPQVKEDMCICGRPINWTNDSGYSDVFH